MSPGVRGVRAELKACAWFLEQGYEVYLNVAPHGKGDLVIYSDKVGYERIDVKCTKEIQNKNGSMNLNRSTNEIKKIISTGVRVLLYFEDRDKFIWGDLYIDNG